MAQKVIKFTETVNNATERTFNKAFDGNHTPRVCFLRAVTFLMSYAPDRDWDLEQEMTEWRLEKV